MGFLDRVIGAVNRVATPLDNLDETIGPSRYAKGDKVAREGEQVQGRILGIERKLDSGTDAEFFALEVSDLGDAALAGTRIRTGRMERLRLGMPVLLRLDDDGRAVLDWPAMCERWGFEATDPAQRPLRSAPGPGVKDTALDMRLQSHLKKWTRARATIVHMEQRIMFDMPTDHWHMDLELADGSSAKASNQALPFYASWLAAVGAEVPAVVDPKDPSGAFVDWPTAANEAADRAGGLDDAPPPGSAAERIEQSRGAGAASVMSTTAAPQADADVAPIEGVSLETWAAVEAGIGRDRVAPADQDAYAQDHGVPAGRWSAIHGAWQARMMGDWRVGVKIGEALEAAKKRR